MLSVLLLTFLNVAQLSAANRTPKQDSEAVGATQPGDIKVNGVTIPVQELRLIEADLKAMGKTVDPSVTNLLREQLIARQLLVEQAHKLDLHKSTDFIARSKMLKEELLSKLYQGRYLAEHGPSQEQVKQAYDVLKQRAGDKEYHLRHIFMLSEEDAKKAITRLEEGDDFAKVATSFSKDSTSRDQGGDLGWLNAIALQPYVMVAINELKKGEYTAKPVKADDGWHILKLEATRPFNLPNLDTLAPQITHELSLQLLAQHIQELRKNASIQ